MREALEAVSSWPVANAAVAVIGIGSSELGAAGDKAQLLAATGPIDRRFSWASVTKLATALSVLVAVEEWIVAIDEPAGPPGSTVAHLLAHASGLGSAPGPPVAPPGSVRIYSNYGYHLLADLLAERSGMAFVDYLATGVTGPLGMVRTILDQCPRSGGPAAGLSGPLVDLIALASEWSSPTLISAGTHRMATGVTLPGLPGVLPGFKRFDRCDWGLGAEVRDDKQPHWTGTANSPLTYGHFGRSGAFLWVDPVAGIACVAVADRDFGPWAQRAWPVVSDAVLAEFGRQAGPTDPLGPAEGA